MKFDGLLPVPWHSPLKRSIFTGTHKDPDGYADIANSHGVEFPG